MTRATFTCDYCRAPVDLHADRCPSCGKAFEAVRCPRCGFQGGPKAFGNGCPKCRYLASPSPSPPPWRSSFGPAMAVLGVLLVLAMAYAWVLRSG